MIHSELILQRSFGFYTHFLAPGDKFLGRISGGGCLEYILNGRGDQDILVIRADILINLHSISPIQVIVHGNRAGDMLQIFGCRRCFNLILLRANIHLDDLFSQGPLETQPGLDHTIHRAPAGDDPNAACRDSIDGAKEQHDEKKDYNNGSNHNPGTYEILTHFFSILN
jgi:hypothetical protein